ncbi:MAG: hypothetical protein HN348_17245 [Proteobacteria bacterium]|nr:hypothetical protein [Pseudomonadota bacterium]
MPRIFSVPAWTDQCRPLSLRRLSSVQCDGYDNILIGADGNSTVGSNAGAAYLILGASF